MTFFPRLTTATAAVNAGNLGVFGLELVRGSYKLTSLGEFREVAGSLSVEVRLAKGLHILRSWLFGEG
jgi:hypothetical protein